MFGARDNHPGVLFEFRKKEITGHPVVHIFKTFQEFK